MKTLSKEAEQEILDAISDVCDEVNGGLDPTSAVVKVATEHSLPKNFVKLVCSGYNNGAAIYQREQNDSILDKCASVPLAQQEDVLEKLYPSAVLSPTEKAASEVVSDVYSTPVHGRKTVEKRAWANVDLRQAYNRLDGTPLDNGPANPVGDPKDRMKHAYCRSLDLRRQREEKRAQLSGLHDRLLAKIAELCDYCRYDKSWSMDQIKYAATSEFGSAGAKVLEAVEARLPVDRVKIARQKAGFVEKRSSVRFDRPASFAVAPFRFIADAVKLAQEYNSAKAAYESFSADVNEKIASTLYRHDAQLPVETRKSVLSTATEKQASFLGGVLTGSISKSLANRPTPSNISSGMADELTDPAHETKLREIQTQTMLQDLLNNDEVISGYDPDMVLDAYNEIAETMPRASNRAAFMRPLLRKRLTQGALEPFEAAEMANVEKTLNESETPKPSPMKVSHVLSKRILD